MPTLTAQDQKVLASLGPHTRRHAIALWVEFPLLRFSSGRRTARRNKAVGGSPTSFHLTGRAVDLTGPQRDLFEAAARVWHMRVGRGCTGPEEVLLEHLGTPAQHLHVAW
jgi:hypothetical protein